MRCWCGNDRLTPFSDGYARCDDCQTLVSEALAAGPVDTRVRDDAADLYGRDYWFGHQTDRLGCPDIVARSRADLADRCPHWLRSLLAFKLPPARVLLSRGADRNAADAFGRTAADVARQLGYVDIAHELAARASAIPSVRQTLRQPAQPAD